MDITTVVAMVTGVDADTFTEELFNEGFEFGVAFGEIEVCECVIGCLEGAD